LSKKWGLNMKFIKQLSLTIMLLIASSLTYGHGFVDQEHIVQWNAGLTSNSGAPAGQEFTPAASDIIGVDLMFNNLASVTTSSTITVRMHQGTISNASLGQTTGNVVLAADARAVITHFDFPVSIALIPGQVYVMELFGPSSDINMMGTNNQVAQIPGYLGGQAIISGNPSPTVDFIFRTYSTTAPPPPDSDNDSVPDDLDLCPATAAAAAVDAAGCSDAQVDSDGDGICTPGAPSGGPSACTGSDNCPVDANPGQEDFDMDGEGDACDDDIDGDSVVNDDDFCADTVIPESVPTQMLLVNRWALVDDDGIFDTRRRGRARPEGHSIEDTAGCSCEQIIPQLLDPDDHQGHLMFGCSISLMDEFVELVTP
jgi:hypothetical protein